MKAWWMAFVAGAVFSIGLGLGGMTDPANVQGFLDFTGDWNPALAFVMGGALGTHALMRRFILKRRQPVLAPSFPSAPRARVDSRLLGGAAIFGVGWGLSGYCPGPAVTAVATLAPQALIFVGAMVAGMLAHAMFERSPAAARTPTVDAAVE